MCRGLIVSDTNTCDYKICKKILKTYEKDKYMLQNF